MIDSSHTLRIATRKSPLALWQAYYVKDKLLESFPDLTVDIIEFVTEGDRRLDASLAKIGGKGLFVKELEKALLNNEADIAVHSIKDMPYRLQDGLILGAICEREDPRDVFVSNTYASLSTLPNKSVVGTSSSRRHFLSKSVNPDLTLEPLRGNVGTRLQKLDDGECDAIILAAAGLIRLSEENRITEYLDTANWIPAPGQGAVGVECRDSDNTTLNYLNALEHKKTRIRITAERAVNEALEGSCQLPIAAYAAFKNDELFIDALVGHPTKDISVRADITGNPDQARTLGAELASKLLELGAKDILDDIS